jgi:3-dehydroquinate dehydratase-2
MEQVLLDIQRAYPDVYLEYRQSNHEGVLIDWVQELGVLGQRQELDGIVLNAGGYTHTSVALRDAVACSQVPVVEVHVSDITAREDFRRVSLMSDVCAHTIMGHGVAGYLEGVEWIIKQNNE